MIWGVTVASSLISVGVLAQSHLDEDLLKMAQKGQTALVETILTLGADVNAEDENGQTALMLAAEQGHAETVAALLDAGADLNAKNKNENTALMIAEQNGQTEMVQLLKIDPKERRAWEEYDRSGLQHYQQGLYTDAETLWLSALEQAKRFGQEDIRLVAEGH